MAHIKTAAKSRGLHLKILKHTVRKSYNKYTKKGRKLPFAQGGIAAQAALFCLR